MKMLAVILQTEDNLTFGYGVALAFVAVFFIILWIRRGHYGQEASLTEKAEAKGSHGTFDEQLLSLTYQPIFSAESPHLVGFEVFLNWKNDGGEVPAPHQGVDLSAETKAAPLMLEWMFDQTCRQIKDWSQYEVPYFMALNVPAEQLTLRTVRLLEQSIAEHAADPRILVVEVAEKQAFRTLSEMNKAMERLNRLGVRLKVDYFGDGISSLRYLSALPIESLKIAVPPDTGHNRQWEKVDSIIEIGSRLNFKIEALNVETEGQRSRIMGSGRIICVQGSLYSPPLNVSDTEGLIIRSRQVFE
ncbi:EAL domain-containing protein [Paenibacillus sp. PK3_47]|uniref:EAL domain-containing protein n=1 Tax=Paenibacillus sp. PK3_47 TaxID=2072642 RepID=UPI00201E2E1F|nr:EAL domain-containing protein [Paenibacillus sp. PK3_47]